MAPETLDIAVVNAVVSVLGTLISAVVAVLIARLSMQAKMAASEVRNVKDALANSDVKVSDKLDEIVDVAHSTHLLVNSSMGEQLKVNAAMSRRIADMTGEESDSQSADRSEEALRVHSAKQVKPEGLRNDQR